VTSWVPGKSVDEQFRLDLDLETGVVAALNKGIELCHRVGDNGSADLAEQLKES
jgi:bacterioferritin (cytochrome b1)